MIPNPGGNVAPENVIGRDHFIERFWKTLDQMGVILVAERRMGKTTIINKMKSETRPGTLLLADDVEGVSLALEFVERVAGNISSHLSLTNRARLRFSKLWNSLGGIEIGGVLKLPEVMKTEWKLHLTRIIDDLVADQSDRVIFFWDEFPWMLQKIARREGPATVADLVDTLRGLRQKHRDLRMVFTGSIGLHHVIRGLNQDGYANSPLNDMRIITVPPLNHHDAVFLALALLQGEGLSTKHEQQTADLIAERVDRVPYYIHHVVAGLADRGGVASAEAVETVVSEALTDAQDPWKLEHYRSRLKDYYGERAGLVRAILDILAQENPLSLDQILEQARLKNHDFNQSSRRLVEDDREGFRDLVKLMLRDHYLRREQQGEYTFSFDLIRRWWRLEL